MSNTRIPAPPETPAAMLARAADLHGRGRLDDASALYRRVLQRAPRDANALNLLGVVHIQRGEHDRAVRLIEKAVAAAPGFAQALHNLGWALQGLGRLDAAAEQYRRALAIDPGLAESHNNLGNVLLAAGRRVEAAESFRRAIAARPGYADAHNNLGDILRVDGDAAAAVAACERALAADPRHFGAANNLGIALLALDRMAESESAFRRAIDIRPASAVAWNGLGTMLDHANRAEEAIEAYRRAIDLDPGYATAIGNLGLAYGGLGRLDEAAECHRRAMAIEPHNVQFRLHLGSLATVRTDWRAAIAIYEEALAIEPDHEGALSRLTECFAQARRWDEAIATARRLHAVHPGSEYGLGALANSLQEVCDWTEPAISTELRRRIDAALAAGQPAPASAYHLVRTYPEPALALANGAAVARNIIKLLPPNPIIARSAPRAPGRLRLGYVSADVRNHAVAHQACGLFALHDRSGFEVFVYATIPPDDSVYRRRMEAGADSFADLSWLDDAKIAEQIHADGIDIAIDMTGYMFGSRPNAMAFRPAPVQVQFQGYPATLGAPWIDYAIVDRVIVPPDEERHWSEAPLCLPHSYFPTDHLQPIAAGPVDRAGAGLPADGFVFASFNGYYKIDPPVFDIWMRLLDAIPGSVLWLASQAGQGIHNLRREAAARGIDPDRLFFAPRTAEKADHLARLRLADLALDTLRFNGFGTTSDALWAGVPVITVHGTSMATRATASMLAAVGLQELVTPSAAAYEGLALALARDPVRLAALRARLADRAASPLFDSPRWVRNLERGYRVIWERHCAGLPPAATEVREDPPP
ncbi:MAG: tetratricopeptide repeat protein [Rhodospirillaceae bacterium]